MLPLSQDGITLFQSTLSMRRATIEGVEARETHDISIHALHEESDELRFQWHIIMLISIHALHEESDVAPTFQSTRHYHFNPRSP